jgi:hypothetical protein
MSDRVEVIEDRVYVSADETRVEVVTVGAQIGKSSAVSSVNGRDGVVTGLAEQASLDAHTTRADNPHGVTKAQVGLSSVDNTSDASKPVSTAQAAAIGAKADAGTVSSHISNTSNPHATTKAQIGLGNADNTSDADKPLSTAAASALSAKANDANVLHTTGSETKSGKLSLNAASGIGTALELNSSDGKSMRAQGDIYLLGKNQSPYNADGGGMVLEPFDGTSVSPARPYSRILFNPEKRDLTSGAQADVQISVHKFHPLEAVAHEHLTFYTSKADGTPIHRFDLQYLRDQASVLWNNVFMEITNTSDQHGLFVHQDTVLAADKAAFRVDWNSDNTNNNTNGFYVFSNVNHSNSSTVNSLVRYRNNNPNSNAVVQHVDQNGVGRVYDIDNNSSGADIYIDHDVTNRSWPNGSIVVDATHTVSDGSSRTKTGALVNLVSNNTVSNGTLTDSAQMLDINQLSSIASGNVVDIDNRGTGKSLVVRNSTSERFGVGNDGKVTVINDNAGLELRPVTAEAGTSIDFLKDPTSTASDQRLGQITAHGTGVGSLQNEMAWYTTDAAGAMQNRMKFWSLRDDTPLILTGARGISRTSGQTIRIGEDVDGGGTSETEFYNNVGINVNPVSKHHVYENTTNTGSTAGQTIEQNGSGDAITQYKRANSMRDFIGIDTSDGHKFKIALDSTGLGVNDAIILDPLTLNTSLNGHRLTDVATPLVSTDGANMSYVDAKVASIVASSPATLDTLKELADALGSDPNYAATTAALIGTKANDSGVVHLTGNETVGGTKTFTSTIIAPTSTNASAAFRIPAGALLTSPLSGTLENDGTNFTYTNSANARQTIVTSANSVTMSNKTLTSPVINTPITQSIVVTVSSAATITTGDRSKYYRVLAPTANYNITLPTTTTTGYEYTFKRVDNTAFSATLVGTIDGATNLTLTTQYKYVRLISNGTSGSWDIVGNN